WRVAPGSKGDVRISPFFSIQAARRVQKHLSSKIIKRDVLPPFIRTIAGVDLAYKESLAIGVAVLLEYQGLNIIGKSVSVTKITFPYVPTLLSFRELKPAYLALTHLPSEPDIVMVDAHGYSHPFRLGFASHLGVVMQKPTIGVAKKILCGTIGEWRDDWAPILDKGEIIGAAVVTRHGAKPVYVSIGNMISLETAIKITMHTAKGYRIPEPTRLAHLECKRIVREL
ncbi:MAG: endonuclease V, partial [Thermoproteales archaeon]|nr:endonuclease V [Thermoproteales archaeon]